MANYDQKKYLQKIISDALLNTNGKMAYNFSGGNQGEQYQIAKSDYEAFREKYSIKEMERTENDFRQLLET